MKKPPITIKLSRFTAPPKGRVPRSPDYLQGYWIRLFWSVMIWARAFPSVRIFEKVQKPSVNHLLGWFLYIKRWITTPLFIIPLFSYLWWPAQGRIVYADPIRPLPAQIDTKPLPELKTPSYELQSVLEPIWINKLRPYGTYPNDYASGNCTFYVASRLPVPNSMGNANNWAYAASLAGLTVSGVPKAGSVAQTSGDSWLGHVAVVESVNPDGSFVISEMNAQGYGVIDSRVATTAEFPNFIYP